MCNRLMSINYCAAANTQSHDANKEGQAGQNVSLFVEPALF